MLITFQRQLKLTDLYDFALINIDKFTETFSLQFYLHYVFEWPEFQRTMEDLSGNITGYIIGKVEDEPLHGHVTALTVAPPFRREGIAKDLMNDLEIRSKKEVASFVDLYVRATNERAIDMYEKLAYEKTNLLKNYYVNSKMQDVNCPDGVDDAYDMRKYL
ncbi:hypothetical protein SNEBB_003797 [Seison nebaliae]|nr:hypothetical protein SNEBB_003797 [Seison nebaliae]